MICLLLTCLVSCKDRTDTAKVNIPETVAAESIVCSSCKAQEILDDIYNKVMLKDGRIYLTFGSRNTLTVKNFNKLILEEQLGLEKGRYTFLIDDSLISALRHNNAFGGIGFGQEWISKLTVRIADSVTGECSETAELIFTLLKSRDADIYLGESSVTAQ